MSLLKNFIKLLDTIPASKPILHRLEEIVHSLQRNSPFAKSKDLRQQVLNVNKEVAAIKKAYPQTDIVTGGFDSLDKIIKDNMSLNKSKPKPKPKPYPTGSNLSGGGNNYGNGGTMLGGGGLGPLWK